MYRGNADMNFKPCRFSGPGRWGRHSLGGLLARIWRQPSAAVEDSDRALIMDFEQLSFISSAGLRSILVIANRRLGGAGRGRCAARIPGSHCARCRITYGRFSGSAASTRSSPSTHPGAKRSLPSTAKETKAGAGAPPGHTASHRPGAICGVGSQPLFTGWIPGRE